MSSSGSRAQLSRPSSRRKKDRQTGTETTEREPGFRGKQNEEANTPETSFIRGRDKGPYEHADTRLSDQLVIAQSALNKISEYRVLFGDLKKAKLAGPQPRGIPKLPIINKAASSMYNIKRILECSRICAEEVRKRLMEGLTFLIYAQDMVAHFNEMKEGVQGDEEQLERMMLRLGDCMGLMHNWLAETIEISVESGDDKSANRAMHRVLTARMQNIGGVRPQCTAEAQNCNVEGTGQDEEGLPEADVQQEPKTKRPRTRHASFESDGLVDGYKESRKRRC